MDTSEKPPPPSAKTLVVIIPALFYLDFAHFVSFNQLCGRVCP